MAGSSGLSPRQRMINLMYLVFIAMLALNMSKEVLSAFGLMNEKFVSSVSKTNNVNAQYLLSLQQKSIENPAKFGDLYESAVDIRNSSSEIIVFLEDIKSEMLSTVDDPMDYETMDQSSFLDGKFFIGNKLSDDGTKFIEFLDGYKKKLLSIVPESNELLRSSILNRFDTGDTEHLIENRDGQKVGWLNYHFEGFPMIASLTKISSIQSDIEITQQEVFQTLLEGQLSKEVSMTNYTTLLEQSKGAYFADENFDGAIVLGRKDPTTMPNEVLLSVDGKSLALGKDYFIEEGRVRLNIKAGNPGDHRISGNLIFRENGEETEVPVDLTYSSISKPNSAVVSADKMNVVYRGVDNPMTISIPGIANNKVRATAAGLKYVNGSSYILRPAEGAYVTIQVSGQLPDGSEIRTSTQFRIKDVPAPSGTVRGEVGNLRMSRSELEKTVVGAKLIDFDFDLPIEVTGFKIKIPDQPTIEIKGDRMDAKAASAIRRAQRGDIIQIFDIKTRPVRNSTYYLKPASAVIVEIVN
jgi:gliding motility-associated protein GldM